MLVNLCSIMKTLAEMQVRRQYSKYRSQVYVVVACGVFARVARAAGFASLTANQVTKMKPDITSQQQQTLTDLARTNTPCNTAHQPFQKEPVVESKLYL